MIYVESTAYHLHNCTRGKQLDVYGQSIKSVVSDSDLFCLEYESCNTTFVLVPIPVSITIVLKIMLMGLCFRSSQ